MSNFVIGVTKLLYVTFNYGGFFSLTKQCWFKTNSKMFCF